MWAVSKRQLRVPSPPEIVAQKSLPSVIAVNATVLGGEGWVRGSVGALPPLVTN